MYKKKSRISTHVNVYSKSGKSRRAYGLNVQYINVAREKEWEIKEREIGNVFSLYIEFIRMAHGNAFAKTEMCIWSIFVCIIFSCQKVESEVWIYIY